MCSLILNWTDKSHDFRSTLIDSGCLFYHVMQLKALETIHFSEVNLGWGGDRATSCLTFANQMSNQSHVTKTNVRTEEYVFSINEAVIAKQMICTLAES